MKTLTIVLNGTQAESLCELLGDCDIHDSDDLLLPLWEGLVSLSIELADVDAELTLDLTYSLLAGN